jgi:hypothetical protein
LAAEGFPASAFVVSIAKSGGVCGVTIAASDSGELGDVFGNAHGERHREEGFSCVIHIESCDENTVTFIGEVDSGGHEIIEPMGFIEGDHAVGAAPFVFFEGVEGGLGLVANDGIHACALAGFDFICIASAWWGEDERLASSDLFASQAA